MTVSPRWRALRPGHRLSLLEGGDGLFPAMVAAIGAARTSVSLETYILDFGRSAGQVAEALEAAARRGIEVRVVVDSVGTGPLPADWQRRWAEAGVHWRIFNPARGWRLLLPRGWRRLHRKLCVVDERLGFCGGVNLVDDRIDPNHGALDQPRFDFSVQVEGPLVADMVATMSRLWSRLQVTEEVRDRDLLGAVDAVVGAAQAGTDLNSNLGRHARRPTSDVVATAGPGRVAVSKSTSESSSTFAGDPVDPGREASAHPPVAFAALVLRDNVRFRSNIERNYRRAINAARHEIVIANAYFIPGTHLQRALKRAAKRGVRVTLLLQGRYEYFMQYHASRAVYAAMLAAGIRIIEYEASFLHAKVAVFDTSLATVGSSNLDPLSLLLAREANIFVHDDAFAADLHSHLLDAIAQGKPVASETIARWPMLSRGLNWLAYGAMRIAVLANGKRY